MSNPKVFKSLNVHKHVITAIPFFALNYQQSLRASRYLLSQGVHKLTDVDCEYERTHTRVCSDMSVLDVIKKVLGNPKGTMEINHWTHFHSQAKAAKFAAWIKSKGYSVKPLTNPTNKNERILVKFTHKGALKLQAMCSRTIVLNTQAVLAGGVYDGWEVCSGGIHIGATQQHPTSRIG